MRRWSHTRFYTPRLEMHFMLQIASLGANNFGHEFSHIKTHTGNDRACILRAT